jgi:pyruvate formate lyase activating enzyme
MTGHDARKYPERGSLFVACEVGGCWSCAVEINEEIRPACVTAIRDGLRIRTQLAEDYIPKRIVHGFAGYAVGAVGTPWWLKGGHITATLDAASAP